VAVDDYYTGHPHTYIVIRGKARAARIANAGYTSEQIKAITGHKTLSEAACHTKAAD
jgi:hypothetical protein